MSELLFVSLLEVRPSSHTLKYNHFVYWDYIFFFAAEDGYVIDWDTVDHHQMLPPIEPVTENERIGFEVSEDYKYAIVTPWYRHWTTGFEQVKYIYSSLNEEKFNFKSKVRFNHVHCLPKSIWISHGCSSYFQ